MHILEGTKQKWCKMWPMGLDSCKFSKGPDCAKNDIIELLLILGCLFSGKTAFNSFKSRFIKWRFWKMSEWQCVIVKENLTIFWWDFTGGKRCVFKRLYNSTCNLQRELDQSANGCKRCIVSCCIFLCFSFLIIKISISLSTGSFRQWMLSASLLHKVAYKAFSQYPWPMRVCLSPPFSSGSNWLSQYLWVVSYELLYRIYLSIGISSPKFTKRQ